MTSSTEVTRRSLLDVVLEACGGAGPAAMYRLVAIRQQDLYELRPHAVVREAADRAALYVSAEELARDGTDLRTLVVAAMTPSGDFEAEWIVDGWSALRAFGAGADLRAAPLGRADLRGARLTGSDLSGADLHCAELDKADLTGADLTGANLAGSSLFSAGLQGADLTEAELCRADLRHADLRGATLRRTALRGADFWGAYLWNVDFSEAFKEGADLGRADDLNAKIS